MARRGRIARSDKQLNVTCHHDMCNHARSSRLRDQANFSEEQAMREREIDAYDAREEQRADELALARAEREAVMCAKRFDEYSARRDARRERWSRGLSPDDRARWEQLRKLWTAHPDCRKQDSDLELWQQYSDAVLLAADETTGNTREALAELEAGDRHCRVGTTRYRGVQYEDPEFPKVRGGGASDRA